MFLCAWGYKNHLFNMFSLLDIQDIRWTERGKVLSKENGWWEKLKIPIWYLRIVHTLWIEPFYFILRVYDLHPCLCLWPLPSFSCLTNLLNANTLGTEDWAVWHTSFKVTIQSKGDANRVMNHLIINVYPIVMQIEFFWVVWSFRF